MKPPSRLPPTTSLSHRLKPMDTSAETAAQPPPGEGYLSFVGYLLIVAGAFCLKPRGRRFVVTAAVINLVNFPHGTTVGILVLHGLARPAVVRAFR